MELVFKKAKTEKEIEDIFKYNFDAFTEGPDFKWTLEDIHHELQDGWELAAVMLEEEIIAAVFYRKQKNTLFTKNTTVKMNYQGHGHSHRIKEFFERKGEELKVRSIVHYCSIDDFRTYSLNESHGYEKTDRKLGKNGHVVEWKKELPAQKTR